MKKLKTAIIPSSGMAESTINGDSLRHSMRRTIKRYDVWSYTEIGTIVSDSMVHAMVKYFTGELASMYLKQYPISIVKDEVFNRIKAPDTSIEHMAKEIVHISKRLLDGYATDGHIRCKLVSDNHTFVINVTRDEDQNNIQFTTFNFDAKSNVCKCCVDIRFGSKDWCIFDRLCKTPFYIGKKERNIGQAIHSEDDIHQTDATTLNLVYLAMKTLLANRNTIALMDIAVVPHNSCEMNVFKKILKKIDLGLGWPVDVFNWKQSGNISSCTESFDIVTPQTISETISNKDKAYPLIDLNVKELLFVKNYVKDKCMFGCEFDKGAKSFNIIKYLMEVPYGKTWRYPVMYDDGTSEEVITTFYIDTETDSFRIYIIREISPGIVAYSSVDYTNASHFHMSESVSRANTSVMFTNIDNIVPSVSSLREQLPVYMTDNSMILNIVSAILSLHIVIHDRPARTRIVNCTRRLTDGERKRNKKHKDDREFIVTRVLKTVVDAKEYVAKMTSEGYPDREYTLESWPRKGYYRRVPGGGRVWIPPTTCHRHLALSEKEIHIKL